MGDCYSVELQVKVNPEKSTVSNLQKLMRQWMREQAKPRPSEAYGVECELPGIDWSLSTYRKAGIRPDSFTGICKILLAFHQGNCKHVKARENDGFDLFVSEFHASYGWHSVMVEAFGKMAWALEEGSRLEIDRDNGHDIFEIADPTGEGKLSVWETHWWKT